MNTTPGDMSAKNKPKPVLSAEPLAAKALVAFAKEKGLSLTRPEGLLKQFISPCSRPL